MAKLFYTFLLVMGMLSLTAQELPEGLQGTDARAWMKANYYTGEFSALTYSNARKKMFAHIANVNDTIECVYSGLKQYLEEGDESLAYPAPFNTEHVVPQSLFGSNEPMRSDIYILQPSYENWNSARSAYPFREIDDQDTDHWYYLLQNTTSIPSQNIDRYSELDDFTAWEPRESRKGDVARAIMYFFTMYPSYDINQVIDTSELCNWHEQDVVDALELQRNQLTEVYQGNINPYIYRPHWANQAWGCNALPPENITPIAIDDQANTEQGNDVTVAVLNNDTDPGGALDPASVTVILGPGNGSAMEETNGTITYSPDPGYVGADTFVYVVCDLAEPPACDTAEVVVSVGQLTGLFGNGAIQFGIYPNPTSGIIYLDLGKLLHFPVNISIVDILGKEYRSVSSFSRSARIDLDIPNGSYIVILRSMSGDIVGTAPFSVGRPFVN